jgi:predicted component of type VI protein secretion system
VQDGGDDRLVFLVTSRLGFVRLVDPAVAHVGRAAECEIRLDDPGISRLHARFYTRGGRLWVEDLRSTNGVVVRGQRITEPTPLDDGDELQIVGFDLTIERVSSGDHTRPAVVLPERSVAVTATAASPQRLLLDGLRDATAQDSLARAADIAELLCETLCIAGTSVEPANVAEASVELLLLADLTSDPRWLDAILYVHAATQTRLDPYALDNLTRRYAGLPPTTRDARTAYVSRARPGARTPEESEALTLLLA